VLENEAPDFGMVAEVLTERVPDDAVVLYDTPSPVGLWRQPFSARPRYMGNTPWASAVGLLAQHPRRVPQHGPVFVLVLDGACAYSVVCDIPPPRWNADVPGWWVYRRFDRFTLYAPEGSADGRSGVIRAMRDFGAAMTPRLGYMEYFLAASLLKLRGDPQQARQVLRQMYERADPTVARRIREYAAGQHLDPFRRPVTAGGELTRRP
jgi:hypothetical protein